MHFFFEWLPSLFVGPVFFGFHVFFWLFFVHEKIPSIADSYHSSLITTNHTLGPPNVPLETLANTAAPKIPLQKNGIFVPLYMVGPLPVITGLKTPFIDFFRRGYNKVTHSYLLFGHV